MPRVQPCMILPRQSNPYRRGTEKRGLVIAEEDNHANQIQEIAKREESPLLYVDAKTAEKETADKKRE